MNNTVTQYDYRISVSLRTEEERTYTSYGISVYQNTPDESHPRLMRHIPDISLSLSRVAELVDRCNRLQPSLVHLDDLVEDCLP